MGDEAGKTHEDLDRSASETGTVRKPAGDKALTWTLLANTLLASLGSFNFGYNISAVNTPAQTFINCPGEASVWSCFLVSRDEWAYVAAMMCAGAIIGSMVASPLTGKIGRLGSVLAANLPYGLGILCLALAQNYWMLIIGRILIGVGVGVACITVPLYLTEISPAPSRGLIGSVHQMMICLGLLVAEIVGVAGLYKQYRWRGMFAAALLPCIIQIVGLLILKIESPRFLIAQGKLVEGESSLIRLRGDHYEPEELDQIIKNTESDQSGESWGIRELLCLHWAEASKSMTVASLLHIGQQVSGINSILFFSSSIFAQEPSLSSRPPLVSVYIAILNMIMTIFAIAMIDKVGRRFLALSSCSIMFFSACALTVGFVIGKRELSIVAVLFFVGSFAFGLGPIPWLMTNEIFPTHAAAIAGSFAVCLNWTFNLLVTASFGKLALLLGSYAFLPYAACLLLLFLFIYFRVPETLGRPIAFI